MDRAFLNSAARIAVPAAMQSMLQASFSAVDQLMIGRLGSVSVAGVGLAGKLASAQGVLTAAVATVAGVMMAQYLGAGDRAAVRRSFLTNLLVALGMAGAMTALCRLLPLPLMRLYTDDQQTAHAAAEYLALLSLSFLPAAATSLLSTLLRCMDRAALPLVASVAAAVCNTALNAVLIFGLLGAPAMGARGAALATVLAQGMGLLLLAAMLRRAAGRTARESAARQKKPCARLGARRYTLMLLPSLICEGLWCLGENVYAAIYGHLGTAACAAMTLTNPVQGMAIGALCGLSQAAGVLIGKRLGKGERAGAMHDARRLLGCGLAGALAVSALILLGRHAYAGLYRAEPEVLTMTARVLAVYAAILPAKALNMILGGGVLRSGGKTHLVMIIDAVGTWGFGVPLGLLAASVLQLPVEGVYALLSLEELVRLAISLAVFRHGGWMQQLSRAE